MVSEQNLLLDEVEVKQKIKRIAYEILERNIQEKEIVFAGIFDKGYEFAEILINEFNSICELKTSLVKVTLDKLAPLQSEISLDVDLSQLQNKTIILTDDVLNTGRTLAYSLKPFLNCEIKKLETAVIVDRGHKSFPISADYIGYSLSTSLKEHIQVELGDKIGVYIS